MVTVFGNSILGIHSLYFEQHRNRAIPKWVINTNCSTSKKNLEIRVQLLTFFRKYGKIIDIEVKSGGFGFVQFQDSRDVDYAVKELDGVK
jgi:hypothetical protein